MQDNFTDSSTRYPSGNIPLGEIDPNPNNPRQKLAEVSDLADSIKEFGLLQPILVRRSGERYEILGGHRRYAAYELLRQNEPHDRRWLAIDAKVVTEQDNERAMQMLISGQVHISAWRPREEAAALEQLVQAGHNFTEVSEIVHKSLSWTSKRLRVYSDSVLSGYVQSGKLAPTVAEQLLPVLDLDTKKTFAERAVKEQWTQDQVKGQVRALRLDMQLRQASRIARQLLDLLSATQPADIPLEVSRDLWTLHGRISVMARGNKPTFPTIEAAQRKAGVKSQDQPLKPGEKRRPGYKPRVMA